MADFGAEEEMDEFGSRQGEQYDNVRTASQFTFFFYLGT